jgi:hypothetical protein
LFAGVLGNVDALVDFVLHPETEYFDTEHFIVGVVTAIVAVGLAVPLRWNLMRLRAAEGTIHTLEAILPICANCKKIKKTGAEPADQKSWQSIDSYIREHTGTEFSHGICPDCIGELYPEYAGSFARNKSENSQTV